MMSPANPLIRHQLGDLETRPVIAEAKIYNRTDVARAAGIGGPPSRQTVVGGEQAVNLSHAAPDTDTMSDFGHWVYPHIVSGEAIKLRHVLPTW